MYTGGYNIGIMADMDNLNPDIDERLATLRFICNNDRHLKVNVELCKKCKDKNCLYFCPAGVYKFEDDTLDVEFENCLECGTCRICCPYNAIKWEYPKNSSGVTYRFG